MDLLDKESPVFTIGQVGERLGISVETIRLYERQGLIIIEKTEHGQRTFSESDVERLICIRSAINEHKISIEGIRRIQSLVPCWSLIQCPDDQRKKCPAFLRPTGGCWTYSVARRTGNSAGADCSPDRLGESCTTLECRACKVYRLSGDCGNIKSLIYQDIIPPRENQSYQDNKS